MEKKKRSPLLIVIVLGIIGILVLLFIYYRSMPGNEEAPHLVKIRSRLLN